MCIYVHFGKLNLASAGLHMPQLAWALWTLKYCLTTQVDKYSRIKAKSNNAHVCVLHLRPTYIDNHVTPWHYMPSSLHHTQIICQHLPRKILYMSGVKPLYPPVHAYMRGMELQGKKKRFQSHRLGNSQWLSTKNGFLVKTQSLKRVIIHEEETSIQDLFPLWAISWPQMKSKTCMT